MSYIPSINIEHNKFSDFRYIVTENAKLVVSGIINGYNAGHHSFTIIGTYGTGKSSFILAFEQDLKSNYKHLIQDKTVLSKSQEFEFLNIVGDYTSLDKLLADKLKCEKTNSIDALNWFYSDIKKKNKFLVIVVDEFGKVLEHAANNNPEKELFFLQKLAEFVNVPTRNILLITTLHQNFGSYAVKLSESQRNEWLKVKGRFEEIVFAEPIEQLLYLTSNHIDGKDKADTILSAPFRIGFNALLQHPVTNGNDSTVFFCNRDKNIRSDHLSVVILPANQRLHTTQTLAPCMKLWLEIEYKIIFKDSLYA